MEIIKNRDILLDSLKGLGILLVVFAHTYLGEIRSIIYLFHVPLFFYLSGAALNYSKACGNMFKLRVRSLLCPYLVFSLLSFFYWICVESHFRPAPSMPVFEGFLGTLDFRLQQFLNIFIAVASLDAMFYNIALWFLPCLFVTLIFFNLLERWMKQYVCVGVLLCPIAYFLLSDMIQYLPFASEISLVAIVFVYLGKISYLRLKTLQSVGGG